MPVKQYEILLVRLYGCYVCASVWVHVWNNAHRDIFFNFLNMFIDFRGRGRGRERERNIDVREKHRLVTSLIHPNWGLNSQPRYAPSSEINPLAFWCVGQRPDHPSDTGQAVHIGINSAYFWVVSLWVILSIKE